MAGSSDFSTWRNFCKEVLGDKYKDGKAGGKAAQEAAGNAENAQGDKAPQEAAGAGTSGTGRRNNGPADT